MRCSSFSCLYVVACIGVLSRLRTHVTFFLSPSLSLYVLYLCNYFIVLVWVPSQVQVYTLNIIYGMVNVTVIPTLVVEIVLCFGTLQKLIFPLVHLARYILPLGLPACIPHFVVSSICFQPACKVGDAIGFCAHKYQPAPRVCVPTYISEYAQCKSHSWTIDHSGVSCKASRGIVSSQGNLLACARSSSHIEE